MSNPLVSVIIPSYKGAESINAAVDSVLNQTYSPIEAIVVDDNGRGSAEQLATEAAMARYKGDSRVRYIAHEKNINGAAARNTGIAASKGEFLCFLDDDDRFTPEKTEKQTALFQSLPEEYGLVYGSFLEHMTEQTDRTVMADSTEDFLYRFLCNEVIACSSTVMIRRAVLDRVKGWDESFRRHQDLEFFARVADGCKVAAVSDICAEKFKLDRNMPKGKAYEEYRMHYLNKMRPIIEKFDSRRQKRLYRIHYTEIGKNYLKQKDFAAAMRWAFKTHRPVSTLVVYIRDGAAYLTRK